eukprot:1193242-Prorocentrum_minimum.AAC.2
MAGGKGVSKAKLAGKGGKVKGDVDVPSEEEEAPAVTNQADMGAKEAVADEKSDEQKQMENTSINTLYEEGDKSIARVRWVFGVFLCACACAFGVSTGLCTLDTVTAVCVIRNNNVFERDVTQSEQDIIDQRVALQRKMFEEVRELSGTRGIRKRKFTLAGFCGSMVAFKLWKGGAFFVGSTVEPHILNTLQSY